MSAQSQGETQQGPSITRATIERLIKENSKLREALKAYTDFDSAGERERGLDECDRRAREALTRDVHPNAPELNTPIQNDLIKAASELLADVRRRYPGEELRCPYMHALSDALMPFDPTPRGGL